MATKTKTRTDVRVHTQRATRPAESPIPGTIGGRLVVCREAAKLRKAQAAKRLGISAQSLGELESGESKAPSAENLLRMRDKLRYDIDYVMRGRGMPLIPDFEKLAEEQTLILIFRELQPDNRAAVMQVAQTIRRAQGGGPSPQDPFQTDPPHPRPYDN